MEPIELRLRVDESLEEDDLVIRGWPLTVDGLLSNATQAMERFTLNPYFQRRRR